MSNKKEKIEVLLNEIWSRGDFSKIKEIISPSYTLYSDPGDPWDKQTVNHEMFIERVNVARTVFPDLFFDIQEIIDDHHKVCVSWIMKGTQKGNLPQLPATNKGVAVPGMTIYSFDENDLVTGHWQVLDKFIMLQDLGVINMDIKVDVDEIK